ncbi:unnamed protein product [Durusdinium trenchii]|uniref:Uncharacterized protein n=2 Tax=Durusdinium trenchii TaxID=1381693 RepID=A0ABP0T0Y0_9DINO
MDSEGLEGEIASHPEGDPHTVNDGFGGIDLEEEIPEENELPEGQNEEDEQPDHADESIARREKLIRLMERFQSTRPEMIRAVRVYQMLICFGQVFWAAGSKDFYHFSEAEQHVDAFLSHSWQVKSWEKILLLMVLKNLLPACVIGTLGSLLMMIPCLFFKLGVQFYCWCCCVGLILWLMTFVFWRSRSTVFVDRMCINQFDLRMKAEGILNIGAVLKASKSLLVVWDESYADRLWCMFEIAAFLKAHPEAVAEKPEMVQVRPLLLGFPVCLGSVSMLAQGVFVLVEPFDNVIFWPVVLLFAAMQALYLVHAFRGYFRSLEATNQRLQQFQLQKCHCWCCSVNHVNPASGQPIQLCDREIVCQCVMRWYGSEEEFDNSVRSVVASALKQQMGSDAIDYPLVLGATAPILWAAIDLAVLWHSQDQLFHVPLYTIRAFSLWLWTLPTAATFGLWFARCFRAQGQSMCTELLKDFLVVTLAMPSLIVFVTLQELTFFLLEDEWLIGACIATLSFLIFAVARKQYHASNRRFFTEIHASSVQ